MFWLECFLSLAMGTIGAYLLYRGKKIMEPKLMLWGGALIVLSYVLFSGGGKDDHTANALKDMLGVPEQQQPQPAPQISPTPTVTP
jgi:hypothetical protein